MPVVCVCCTDSESQWACVCVRFWVIAPQSFRCFVIVSVFLSLMQLHVYIHDVINYILFK